MRTIKCDLCKIEINNHPINIRFGLYENVEFCDECGLPVLNFLKKHKFIKDKDKKIKSN